jgi:hypothetical protein
MILLKDLLLEKMTFNQLLAASDKVRIAKSKSMDVRALKIVAEKDGESWTFSYKSRPSTTGQRFQGYIRFLKGELKSGKSADDMNCIVDCTCPDYRYSFAYNNTKQGAGVTGNNSWNKNNGNAPQYDRNKNVGLCKHLIALGKYLKTKLDNKPTLKESVDLSNALDGLITECNGKFILVEGVLFDYVKQRIEQLEKVIPELEAKYDELDNKSLSTFKVRQELIKSRNELSNLKNIEL